MKLLDRLVIIIFNISLLLVTIWAIIIPITKSKDFYEYEFNKNNTTENTYWYVSEDKTYYYYTNEQLTMISEVIIDYLMGRTDNMQVVIEGRNVFSNQALIHMKDVKALYTGGRILGWVFFGLLILTLIYMIFSYKRIKPLLFKYTMLTLGGIGLILLGFAIYALIDFNGAFVLFHRLAFPTDQKFRDAFFAVESNYKELYYINNLTLTNILSIEIFMDAAFAIFGGVFIVLGGWISFVGINNKKQKKNSV